MSVLGDPVLKLDGKPETEDANGYYREEQPEDASAEELNALTVKGELLAVDNGVVHYPSLHSADCPWRTDSECDDDDEERKKIVAYHAEKLAVEF